MAVGAKIRKDKWMPTARQHQEQYLNGMRENQAHLPKSNFIEESYKAAAEFNRLPETVSVDLVLNNFTRNQSFLDSMIDATKAQSSIFNADSRYGIQEAAENLPNWDSVILKADRRAPDWTETSLTSYDALSRTLNAGLGAMTDYPQDVIDYKRANANYLTSKQRQLAKQGKLRREAPAPAQVAQPQSFGQRYGLSPKLSNKDIVSMLETKLSKPSLLSEPVAKATTTAAAATTAPTTDVITAKDGHLIGFAERHGLGWRDVWELNKETIPNPNAVQAGTTLNLPSKRSVNKAPDANAFMSTQAAAKRRTQTQPRFNAGGLYTDYLSPGSQSTAKRAPNRNANTAGFNMDLLSTSVNKAARGDYGVTLGGWSPSSGVQTDASTQEKASARGHSKELAAVDARTDRELAQQARQAAAAKVQSNQDQPPHATNKEEAQVGTPSPARRASVEKLGESVATTSLENQNDLTSDSANAAAGQGQRAANASARARADAATTAKERGAARHEAATRTANGQDTARYGEKGNVLDVNGDKVGVGFDRFGRATSVGNRSVNANQTNQARNKDGTYSFDADGNGAGDAGGTVICTELYRQGLIDKHVYRAGQRFGLRLLRNDPDVITSYHLWAKPVVRLMRKSPLFTQIVYKSVGEAWAREMSLREGLNGFGTVRGKLVIAVGIPACRMIGRMLATCSTGERTLV